MCLIYVPSIIFLTCEFYKLKKAFCDSTSCTIPHPPIGLQASWWKNHVLFIFIKYKHSILKVLEIQYVFDELYCFISLGALLEKIETGLSK